MFDIEFFQKVHTTKQLAMERWANAMSKRERLIVYNAFERARNKTQPIVYNIETTNACNMRCKMCPRTTKMTRPVETMDMDTFKRIVDQLRPWYPKEWEQWKEFVLRCYDVTDDEMSENHFYLLIIPKVIQLHGYGAPLLDKYMVERVGCLTARGLPSYFSCNPANIDVPKFQDMMEAGLSVVKFSIESVDDARHKEIRGSASNFSTAYKKIRELLAVKKDRLYGTTIVITMLDLGQQDQDEQYGRLVDAFNGRDVYIYMKSQDQHWYDDSPVETKSIHWSEPCHHPWSSMTIKSDGMAAMCMEDYNNEIILGDAKVEALINIWNGPAYQSFRKLHFQKKQTGVKCYEECDMRMIGDYFHWDGVWHA